MEKEREGGDSSDETRKETDKRDRYAREKGWARDGF